MVCKATKSHSENRICEAVSRVKKQIREKGLSKERLAELSKGLDIALDEYCRFHELKSLGILEGKLTLEEAQTVYGYLGEIPNHFNGQPVEVKIVLTQVFHELLESRIREVV